MNNILKSKMFFGLMLVSIFLITHTANAYTHAGTLRLGMSGSQVVSLQERLNVSPRSGYFGNLTQSAVMNFQSANNLTPDGVVGYQTGILLAGNTLVGNLYPEGCNSSSGFSTTTGQSCVPTNPYPIDCSLGLGYSPSNGIPCSGASNLSPGCTFASTYSTTTGKLCDTAVAQPQFLIEGCFSGIGYSITSGKPCSTDITSGYLLEGGAGYLVDVKRVFPVATNIGIQENVSNATFAGYRLVADNDSDLAILSFKISLRLTSGTASNRLNKYVQAIKVSQNGTVVGSADVSAFSRSDNVYSATISLNNATMNQGQESDFLLKVQTLANIDSGNVDNVWTVTLNQVHYKDATGIIINDPVTGAIGPDGATNFHFVPVDSSD